MKLIAYLLLALVCVILTTTGIMKWVQNKCERRGCEHAFGICQKGDDGYCARCHSEMY